MYLRSPRLWNCMIYFKNSTFTFCALCQNVVSDRFCSWNNFTSPLPIHCLNYDIYVYAFSAHPLTWNSCRKCCKNGRRQLCGWLLCDLACCSRVLLFHIYCKLLVYGDDHCFGHQLQSSLIWSVHPACQVPQLLDCSQGRLFLPARSQVYLAKSFCPPWKFPFSSASARKDSRLSWRTFASPR